MNTTTKPIQRRRKQERAEVTKSRLIDAAIQEFSDKGFNGVTARDIEVKADVQRGLLKYHFGDKADLWKAAISKIFGELKDFRHARLEMARDLPPEQRLAFRIRSFVRFTAKHPELNRLMAQEGKHDSWRLRYILDTFLRQMVMDLRDLTSEQLNLTSEEFCHWYYIYIGSGAFMFSMAPEAKKLFGIDVTSEEFVDRHADMVADLLISRMQNRDLDSGAT